jgi:hypothetical protein
MTDSPAPNPINTIVAYYDKRFAEAVITLSRLPKVKVAGYSCAWPEVLYDVHEKYGWTAASYTSPPPPAAAISRLDQVLEWVTWMDQVQRHLVWARVSRPRLPWGTIAQQMGCSIATAQRERQRVLVALHYRVEDTKRRGGGA